MPSFALGDRGEIRFLMGGFVLKTGFCGYGGCGAAGFLV